MMLQRKLPFSDAHCHSNPVSGLGARRIAEKFVEAGGWFLSLVMLPSWSYSGSQALTLEEYIRLVNLHVRECESARAVGLKVACFAGYHPAEIDRAIEKGLSYRKIVELGRGIIDVLVKLCVEGRLQGIGEIGRQHYKTRPESVVVANELLHYAMVRSRDSNCTIQLHLENTEGFTVPQIETVIQKVGMPKNLIILHHVRPRLLKEAIERGLWSTTPGVYESLKIALESFKARNTLVESDFLDDPKRPGAVIEPWRLIEHQVRLHEQGVVDDRVLEKLNVSNVEAVFRISP
uniref:Hydrolase TatD n=1 Tax=Fervidicoccus fontis TaxID=683846 RepID=A0A7J3ZK10_9CREN